MKIDIGLTKSKTLKEIVHVGHSRVRSLRNEMGLINEEVHLSREPLTAHAKDAALPRNKEVQWAWLHGVTRQMYLLCVIEAVVHPDLTAAGSTLTKILQLELGHLGCVDHPVVVCTREVHDSQMFLSDTSQ